MKWINNKRGDKILSIYWFAILLIVAGGIFGMVYVFYGTPYDVREIEARILTNQIADCVSYAGRINLNLISGGAIKENSVDYLEECHLIFNSSEWENEQYYSKVEFYRLENTGNSVLTFEKGNNNWVAGCSIQEGEKQDKLATCLNKKFYSVDDANNQYIIKILTIVRKAEKNVKI